jgi:Flp pilus assembly protein TadG
VLTRLRMLWTDRRGSALVEATLVTPVLFALIFGVYEGSWFFYRQHLISTGVKDAARYMSRVWPDPTTGNPCTAANIALAKGIAVNGSATKNRVSGWTADKVTITCAALGISVCGAATPCTLTQGAGVVYTVTVSTLYTPATLGLLGYLGLAAPSISVVHNERVIGIS